MISNSYKIKNKPKTKQAIKLYKGLQQKKTIFSNIPKKIHWHYTLSSNFLKFLQ